MKDQIVNQDIQLGFKLNMRIIADVLEREFIKIEYYASGDRCRLEGVKLYNRRKKLDSDYVYCVQSSEVNERFLSYHGIAFIVIGRSDASLFSPESSVIQILDDSSWLEIFDMVQDAFEKYKNWDWRLQRALYSSKPLDEMILASLEVFRNPMFIHDTNFFILADPKHSEGMLDWETDSRTGRSMVPMSVINDFMVDPVYLEGMKTKGALMYPAEQRGYQILYFNLWNDGYYEGRILVDEIDSPIQPGDFYTMEYLGHLVEHCIKQKKIILMSMGNDIEHFFIDFLDGKITDERFVVPYLNYLSWNRYDRYLCLSMISDQKEFNMVSSLALLGQVEAQIASGQAIMHDNSIVVIVNLSYSHSTAADVLSKLAVLLRDSLLKVGVSSCITDFMLIPQASRQAHIALNFGRSSRNTCWYYYFDDYMLEYMIDCASREIPVSLLCCDSLCEIKKYDEANHTELYNTLWVYLCNNRNVLQTAKELYIHRSTLSYRLKKIYKISGVDLDDPKERLKLMISYVMLKNESV